MYSAHAKLWTSGSCHPEEISMLQVAVIALLLLLSGTVCTLWMSLTAPVQRGRCIWAAEKVPLKQEAVGRRKSPLIAVISGKQRLLPNLSVKPKRTAVLVWVFTSTVQKDWDPEWELTLATSHGLAVSRNPNRLFFLHYLTLLPDPAHFSFAVASHSGGAFHAIFLLT